MSGGGDSKRKKKNNNEEPAPAPMQTVPAFMPGFDNMLAQQLAAGGYGSAPDLLAYMNAIHTPMQLPTTTMPPNGGGSRHDDDEERQRRRRY